MVEASTEPAFELDVNTLTPSTYEVISKQATINIGMIGHVSHGKSTLVYALSRVKTQRHGSERIRNITIKLGYANAKIYKCECPEPDSYHSFPSSQPDFQPCDKCNTKMQLVRHVSFVDCPGHDIFMATMLNGAAVMDAAILLISANESCPQPQTSEHLAAVEIMNLQHIIIVQNKMDLLPNEEAGYRHYEQIKAYISRTKASNAPIIPTSAQLEHNINYVLQYICSSIPDPIRDFQAKPRMIVIRSFDVNRPGSEVDEIVGGVAGGSILCGILKRGDEVEIRPGIVQSSATGKVTCKPIRSKVISLKAEQNDLQFAVPGGLIGVGLSIDPSLTKGDGLVGQVFGHPGDLPDLYIELEICYYLLMRIIGVKADTGRARNDKVSYI